VLERKAPHTFDIIIEMIEKDKLAIHHDVASTVDRILRGETPRRRCVCACRMARFRLFRQEMHPNPRAKPAR
jgi:hypothetical protein